LHGEEKAQVEALAEFGGFATSGDGIKTAVQADGGKKLLASFRLCPECSQQAACDHRHAWLKDPSCGHALMRSFDHHADSTRLQNAVQTVRYFCGHFFLNLKTLCVDLDEACILKWF